MVYNNSLGQGGTLIKHFLSNKRILKLVKLYKRCYVSPECALTLACNSSKSN